MTSRILLSSIAAACLLAAASGVRAQAIGSDVFASRDADHSEVLKLGVTADFRHADAEHYQGLRLEHASYSPLSQPATRQQRVYYRFADTGAQWKWNGSLGTNGHTWLGGTSIRREGGVRQEYFVERDVIETPQGLARRLHYTFAAGAFDVDLGAHDALVLVAGVQDFTGRNQRRHARLRYAHAFGESGFSLQLRTRYFSDTHPHEYDYFSPSWYFEAIPVAQLRRFRGGWQYQLAGGVGRQRDADSGWHNARLVEASVTSPVKQRAWYLKAALTHSNTPITTGYTYDYTQLMLEWRKVF